MNFVFHLFHFLGESPSIFAHGVIHFCCRCCTAKVLRACMCSGGWWASALVLDLVLAAGVVDLGAVCAATTLRCLRFFRLVLVLVLCIGGCAFVGFSIGPKNTRPIWCLSSSSDCAIDSVSRWAVSVFCTLRTEWVIVKNVVCTLELMGWCYLVSQTIWRWQDAGGWSGL